MEKTSPTLSSPYGFWLAPECVARCLVPPEPKLVPKVTLRPEYPPGAALEHVEVDPLPLLCDLGVL